MGGLGQSRISRDRIERLESIGFQWRLMPEKIKWEERFEVSVHHSIMSVYDVWWLLGG